jgi:hypothetical protein
MAKVNGVYLINGEEYTNIKQVSEVLGMKVTKKEVLAGQIPEVAFVEVPEDYEDTYPTMDNTEHNPDEDNMDDIPYGDYEDASDPNMEPPTDEDEALTNTHEEDDSDDVEEPVLQPPTPKQKLAEEEVDYPEVGAFKTEKELKKYYKQLSDEQLVDWMELEGLSHKPCDHPSINRMRMCMAIKDHHFPKQAKSTAKPKAKYAKYATEELIQMAIDNDVDVEPTESMPIMRMRTIMALRSAGVIG